MLIETLSVFPEMFEPVMSTSILGRARKAGLFDFKAYNLRDWTHDRHRTVDDEPYGGGQGMLMKVEPIAEATRLLAPRVPSPRLCSLPPWRAFTHMWPSACSKVSACCLCAAATRASTSVRMRMPMSVCRSATTCLRVANFPLWSLPMPSYA